MGTEYLLLLQSGGHQMTIVIDTGVQPLHAEGTGAVWRSEKNQSWERNLGVASFWRSSSLHLYTATSAPIAILDGFTARTTETTKGRGLCLLHSEVFPRGQFEWLCTKVIHRKDTVDVND